MRFAQSFVSNLRKWHKPLPKRLILGLICAAALASCANTSANTSSSRSAPKAAVSAQEIGPILQAQGYIAVPMRRVGAGLDTVKLGINGVQGTFLLDTGASNSVIDTRVVPKFRISVLDLRGSDTAIGAGGEVRLSAYKVSGLTLQGQKFPFSIISATDLSNVVSTFARDTGIQLDGIIGQDVMIAFDGVIDIKNRTLYLRLP